MNRRDLLVAGAALGALAAAGPTTAFAAIPAETRKTLLDALGRCETDGLLCTAHCAGELAEGNKDMAECAAAVAQMTALLGAARALVGQDAKLAKSAVLLCKQACDACAEACKKHEPHFAHGMHLACKSCMESCLACSKACATFAA